MKIALFTHELGLNGAPRALFNMAKCLLKNGHDIDVYSPFNGPLGVEFESVGINVIVQRSILDEKPLMEPKKYDVLLFNTIVSLIMAKNTKEWDCNKRIAWIHEGPFAYKLFETTITSYGLGRKLNFKDLIQYVDDIYCVSDWSADITEKYTDKEVKILPYYIENSDHKRCRKESQGLTIGLIGTVEERKGIKVLAEALKKVPNNIRVISIGTPMQPIPSDKIVYLGKMPHEKVLDAYNNFDLLICPSEDDPMPIVCAEAFMLGCPVFASNNTGVSLLIKQCFNGYTFEYSVKGVKDAINWANQHRHLLNDMGERGKQIYKDVFTLEVFNKEIDSIFKSEEYGVHNNQRPE